MWMLCVYVWVLCALICAYVCLYSVRTVKKIRYFMKLCYTSLFAALNYSLAPVYTRYNIRLLLAYACVCVCQSEIFKWMHMCYVWMYAYACSCMFVCINFLSSYLCRKFDNSHWVKVKFVDAAAYRQTHIHTRRMHTGSLMTASVKNSWNSSESSMRLCVCVFDYGFC